VRLGPQIIRLKPAGHSRTVTYDYSLKVTPQNSHAPPYIDEFGNACFRCVVPDETTEFVVDARFAAVCAETASNPFDFLMEPHAATFPFRLSDETRELLSLYLVCEPFDADCASYFSSFVQRPTEVVRFLWAVLDKIRADFSALREQTGRLDTASGIVARRAAEPDEFNWLLVQLLRFHGIPARSVCGYEIALTGVTHIERDELFYDHWVEAFLPGAGWIGLRPWQGMFCAENLVPLAAGPHPKFCRVVNGFTDECEARLEVGMSATRMWVTRQ
jgi:transglutaminase-like putative cysteine protease